MTAINPIEDETNKNTIITNGLNKHFIIDMSFHFIIKGIGLTLISSIFIITYFDFKKTNSRMEHDNNYVCYICHLDRDIFLKYKINFKYHVNKYHKMLNYIYYIIFLITKNQRALNKTERYLLDKFIIGELFWIPCKDTLELQKRIKEIKEQKFIITTEFN